MVDTPRGARDRRAVRDRRRRHAARRHQDRRRDRAARPADRGHRHPQDDRQRHPLHRSQLRLRERVRRRGRGDPQRARRGDGRAQRHRPGEADGPAFGLHRLPRGARVDRRQLRADPGGAAAARRRSAGSCAASSAAWPSARTRSSSSPRAPARISAPTVRRPTAGRRPTPAATSRLKDIGLVLRDRITRALPRARRRDHAQVHRPELSDPQRAGVARRTASSAGTWRATRSTPRWPATPRC